MNSTSTNILLETFHTGKQRRILSLEEINKIDFKKILPYKSISLFQDRVHQNVILVTPKGIHHFYASCEGQSWDIHSRNATPSGNFLKKRNHYYLIKTLVFTSS